MLRSTHKHLANVDILHRPLPPPVNAHIGGPCEPGVQDVDASQAVRPPDGLPQGRVVVQPQSLPEPVDGVDHHVTRLLEVRKRGGGVQIKKTQQQQRCPPLLFGGCCCCCYCCSLSSSGVLASFNLAPWIYPQS